MHELSSKIDEFIVKAKKSSWMVREKRKRREMQSPVDISRKRFHPSKKQK